MSRDQVMRKHGFSDQQYAAFATTVGHTIDFNKKMNMIARHLNTTRDQLKLTIQELLSSPERNFIDEILEFRHLQGQEDYSLFGVLSREIQCTTARSFSRFGDRNMITDKIRLNYLDSDGTPLDVQAQMLEESFSLQIDPCDLIDFMTHYPDGPGQYISPVEVRIKDIRNELYSRFGFWLSTRIADRFYDDFISIPQPEIIYPF